MLSCVRQRAAPFGAGRLVGSQSADSALIVLWLFGRGDLPADQAAIRAKSFIWPTVACAVGIAVVAYLTWMHRRSDTTSERQGSWRVTAGRQAGVVLLVCETAFLVTAGAPLWTSSATPFASTPSMVALKSAVGQSVVGLGCFIVRSTTRSRHTRECTTRVRSTGVGSVRSDDPERVLLVMADRESRVTGSAGRLDLLPGDQLSQTGSAVRGLVRGGASGGTRSSGRSLRQEAGKRGSLSDPQCGRRHAYPTGDRRPVAVRQRSRHTCRR